MFERKFFSLVSVPVSVLFLIVNVSASQAKALEFKKHEIKAPPHLDLEMTSNEYRMHLKAYKKSLSLYLDDKPVAQALAMGERLSQWIAFENSHRDPSLAIRLTSSSTRRGIPIDSPSIYSDKTIERDLEKAKNQISGEVWSVLMENISFPNSLPISDEEFIKQGRLLDRIYQTAARYKSLKPYIFYYKVAIKNDVRGYYYFWKNNIKSEDLTPTSRIGSEKLETVLLSLIRLCLNSGISSSNCKSTVEKSKDTDTLNILYDKWFVAGKKNWDSFFNIPNTGRRSDVEWSDNKMVVPFNTPDEQKFQNYLKDNIEDEFKWNDWSLILNFGSYSNGPRLVFQAGSVPHVNGLGGNEIVMDNNQPIEEYESKWTIRHEFGHVIGFPDCYHEFYDESLEAFVNYQLDITDLMCSRAGNMNERIFQELVKQYNKSSSTHRRRSWGIN